MLLVLTSLTRRYFSVAELAQRTGIGGAVVKRLLLGFERARIVSRADKNKQPYYQINRKSADFSELLSVLGNEKASSRDPVARIIMGIGDIKYAALTGIFIGLTGADCDLLLVGTITGARVDKAVKELEEIVGNEINYATMNEAEYKQRLYSFDWFIKEILEREPVVIVDKLSYKNKKPGNATHIATVFSNLKK